jgi:hypothetical protein
LPDTAPAPYDAILVLPREETMNRKRLWLAVLLTGCLTPGFARAQGGDVVIIQGERPVSGAPAAGVPVSEYDRFANWETHPRACCTGPVSDKPPIQTELYFRTGPSFIVGGGIYGNSLDTGWTFQGGAKTMFFNPYFDAAWYIDLGLGTTTNSANDHPQSVILIVDDLPNLATIRGLNRTTVNVGLGRAWYLWAPADSVNGNLRVAWDGGGRYGSARGDFFEITHETDVIGGLYTGIQADWEWPCQNFTFQLGVRLEYGYTWSDMLQRKSDVQDVNLLFQAGVRF